MPDALDNVITQITTLMAGMAGIDQAPTYPPEGITPPMVVTYHVRAVPYYSAGGVNHLMSTIHCDVFLARAMLPHAEQQARPYILRALSEIAGSITLSDNASHCYLEEIIGPGVIPYAGENYFGIRLVLEVKLVQAQLNLTVAA